MENSDNSNSGTNNNNNHNPPPICLYVTGDKIPTGHSLVNGFIVPNNMAAMMAQVMYNPSAPPKKASGDNYGIPELSGDLNSNPVAWLKNAKAALKSFQVLRTNWVPEAAKHLKGAARAWYTNWIDANLNFDNWDLFKEDFLVVFTNNKTDQDLSLLMVNIR